MKKTITRVLALTVVMMIVLLSFPVGVFADVENSEPSREFNIFLDAGEITDEFISQTSQIIAENWSDDYFSSITMTLGEDVMLVDGEEVELSFTPSLNNEDKLFLPVPELAETIGATVEINQQTGNILVETSDGQTNLTEFANDSDFVIQEEHVLNSEIAENSQVTMECLEDETESISLRAIQEEQAEELFYLDVSRQNNKIIITKPYQTKEIILFVHGGRELANNYQAESVVTNDEGLYFLQYNSEEKTKNAYEAFLSNNSIDFVEINGIDSVAALPSPGSWGTDGNNNSMGIQASRMINHLQGNTEEIIVAVVDTGIDGEYLSGTEDGRAGHPHLAGRTTVAEDGVDDTAGHNFINNTNNPYDDHKHGTHVAGTIVDCTPDNVSILPVKVLDNLGKGHTLNVSKGIKYAVDCGASVINLSLGGSCASSNCLHQQAIEYAIEKSYELNRKIPLFVVAAGNESGNADNYCLGRLSELYDNVITVAAVDENDFVAPFSNYGNCVDVCAPGVGILSSVPGGNYASLSGTSMATPHVSAAVAMLVLAHPDYSDLQLKTLLKSMVVDLGEPGSDPAYGAGRIDFRMYSNQNLPSIDSIPATGFSLQMNVGNGWGSFSSVTIDNYLGTALIGALVSPKEATNKAASFTINDPTVAIYQNARIEPECGGIVIATCTMDGMSAQTCVVNVKDKWSYHAADSFGGGTGTQNDPYLLSNAEQLAKLSYDSYFDGETYFGKYFKLTTDIDLQGKYWVPIAEFRGVFDGDGHAIINMMVNDYMEETFLGLVFRSSGLFAKIITPSIVKNLAVLNANVDIDVSSEFGIGALCGEANKAQINNCYVTGTIPNGAGIVGNLSNGSSMNNCYSVVVNSKAGLVTRNAYSSIYNSYASGVSDVGFAISQNEYSSTDSTKTALAMNSFSVIDSTSEVGFVTENKGNINKCYYLNSNTYGVKTNKSENVTVDLTGKDVDFFTQISNYTNTENWDSSSPWDFENVWAIDPNYQGGLPYLKIFPKRTLVTGMALNQSVLELKPGQCETLTVTFSPSTIFEQNVRWSSSYSGAVSVDRDGKITANKETGSATITALALDGSGKKATCRVYIDDHDFMLSDATSIERNNPINGTISYGGDIDCFVFTPDTSGTYFFYTKGTLNTKGILCDSDGNQLKTNDDWDGSNNRNFGMKHSLVAGEIYYIKVSANNNTAEGSYEFIIDDDHANDSTVATTIALHSKTNGSINYSTDEDWFAFTPTASGSYLFYTTGSTDTKGTLYNSSETQLKVNNNGSINGSNFALAYSLTAGQTYYIKVSNNNSSTGAYTLNVSKSFYSASYTNTNADARKVQMSAEAASVLTNLTITINGTTYSLTKPTSGSLDKTVNGVRFKVTFTSKNSGLSTLWNITASFPATAIGSTTTTKFTFSKGIVTGISSSNLTGLVAYGSSYKTNLTPNTYLSSLLSSMATSGYTFTAYNWNDQQITATTTTKVATGQKIVQKNSSGKIVHIYYLVLFGDVAGSGVVGDGLINAVDSMKILQEIEETFLGAISKLAADADHNGSISQADADLILNHAVGKATINQNVAITQAVDNSCYYQNSVVF